MSFLLLDESIFRYGRVQKFYTGSGRSYTGKDKARMVIGKIQIICPADMSELEKSQSPY